MLKRLLLFSLLVLIHVPLLTAQIKPPNWSVKQLVEYHQQLHQGLTARDVYKLLFQASFGVEHILSDSAAVSTYLLNELSSIDTASSREPLIENISLDDEVVRINLRTFKALNLSSSELVKVMFQSAAETIPDTTMFYRQWNEFSALARYGMLKFAADDVKPLDANVEAGKIDPVHHSPEYAKANHPAYRVVRRRVFEATFGKMNE